jgi:hypothetical protein
MRAALLALMLAACAGRMPPMMPMRDGSDFRRAFNEASDLPRLIVVISPT